jgi:hypothetical protein
MPNRRRWTAEQKRAISEEYDSTPWGRRVRCCGGIG